MNVLHMNLVIITSIMCAGAGIVGLMLVLNAVRQVKRMNTAMGEVFFNTLMSCVSSFFFGALILGTPLIIYNNNGFAFMTQ